MRRLCWFACSLALVSLAACGNGGGGGDDDDDDVPPDAEPIPEGWETLIESSWTLAPGETYMCERLTVTEDVWIRAFRATAPLGSHHTVLTVGDPQGADGPFACGAGTNQPAMVYGAAVGTNDIEMPEGVAVKVPAGKQLLLNLHLYNTQPGTDLTGTSQVLIERVPEDEVAGIIEAEIVLMGPVNFSIPAGKGQEVTGGCTMSEPATLFMVNPHMHQLGVHALVNARRAAGDVEMHDGPYSFNEQRYYELPSIEMAANDRVEIVCTYDNDTGGPVPFGDSSDDEMCFASTYRYPAVGGSFGIVCPL
jgi:hypothetical protein